MKLEKKMMYRGHGKEKPIVKDMSYRKKKGWLKFVAYMRTRKFYYRKEAHKALKVPIDMYSMGTPIDGYRAHLTRAGFLRVLKPGVYERVKEIPKHITIEECVAIYQQNREGKN